ncbi:methionine ABC transporter substrate-binding protein [Microbacterium hominis]|uniref:Methionine ABC transporter substrate-binding protein n=1 Tax=Microbacterium hominis TaxID=162426 RepID=A0A134DF70_9MICO|nr:MULTISPECIES: MetQ/NlpA family ABC transporter substrate-binding protein [Microbacterium]AUG28961.1 methionine ABC transporter substrate-binding protein [Microbacterium hominis]KXC05187.1 methionine ABC transporter substrate-binding protein [Microbacterium hominis]QOC24714.1 methionine ABC transporter substrate-binding protein [Microbacterium hominis]QOC28771.1 methionine ABC transporter substrate-binding protein [Microbacterium hominis]QRY40412.1 methionine ABC transporter substrate-bindin
MSKKTLAAALALPLVLLLSACASGAASPSDSAGASSDPVRIGVVGAGDPYWETYKEAAAAEGINVEIVNFDSYDQPNPALSAGELDLNQFQHIIYLATYNVKAGDDLVPIGATAIYPLGLYSTKYASVADIPAGETIAVPNDESNQARALLVLQSAGLITLKDGGSIFSAVADIEPGSKVKVEAVAADFTASSLPDFAGAVVNNDFVAKSGLTKDQLLAQDDPADSSAFPYINIFAAKAADADNPTYAKLVELYQNTAAVQEGVLEASGGTAVLLKTPVADLVTSLKKTEDDIRAQQ